MHKNRQAQQKLFLASNFKKDKKGEISKEVMSLTTTFNNIGKNITLISARSYSNSTVSKKEKISELFIHKDINKIFLINDNKIKNKFLFSNFFKYFNRFFLFRYKHISYIPKISKLGNIKLFKIKLPALASKYILKKITTKRKKNDTFATFYKKYKKSKLIHAYFFLISKIRYFHGFKDDVKKNFVKNQKYNTIYNFCYNSCFLALKSKKYKRQKS